MSSFVNGPHGVIRSAYLDALRVLAILLVVLNYLPGYTLYQTCMGPKAWMYMVVSRKVV